MSFTAIQIGPYSHKVRMPAFADGVRACGGVVREVMGGAAEQVVAAINETVRATGERPWMAFTAGHHPRDAGIRGVLRASSVPLLVLDLGYLKRAPAPGSEEGYFQVGLGGLCWVPALAELPVEAEGDPFTRSWARRRFSDLDVQVASPVDPSSRPPVLLVLGQKPRDGQHGMDDVALAAWLTEQAGEYFARGWRIRFRPHPRAPELRVNLPGVELLPTGEGHPLAGQFAGVREVLTVNSTAGLEALIAGLPVRSHPCAHYHKLGRGPAWGILVEHLTALAAAQWTLAELRSGLALRFMARFLPRLPGTEGLSQLPRAAIAGDAADDAGGSPTPATTEAAA